MRYITCLMLLTLGSSAITRGQEQVSKTAQQQIIDLERSFAAAIKTQDTMQTKKFQDDSYFLD